MNSSMFRFICVSSLFVGSVSTAADVKLKQGVVSGTVEVTFFKGLQYYAFKGIPYAEPPLGTLRFLPPRPHSGWQGTLNANSNSPTCLQMSSRMRMGEPFGISGSEDCLYISVFSPNLEGKAAVVVFDYNDNFRTGFNGTDTYSPDFFLEEDVVVVTVNHRLGVFGYLTTDDDVIPANAGVKDFILGLDWVKDNINQFGGDPDRVTLMGNRGGAALANILLYTEKAKGLFSRITLQSGTALEPIYFYNDASTKAFQLGEVNGVSTNDSAILLKELQACDAEKLLSKAIEVVDSDVLNIYQINVYPFAPTVEKLNSDRVIGNLPEKSAIQNDVSVLIGLNSRDGLDIVSFFIAEPLMLGDIGHESGFHFPIRPDFRFDRNSSIFKDAINEIAKFYYEAGHIRVHAKDLLNYATYIGDTLQNYAIDYAANKLAKELASDVFYYMFDFRGILNENSEYIMKQAKFSPEHWGATVTDELCYLHLCTRIKANYETLKKMVSEQSEIKVLKKMVRLWTNFAKFGNPTPVEDKLLKIKWLPIEKTQPNAAYLHIDKKLKMKTDPLGERKLFWKEFLNKFAKFAINGVVDDNAVNYVKTAGRTFVEKVDEDFIEFYDDITEEIKDDIGNADDSEIKEVLQEGVREKVIIVDYDLEEQIETLEKDNHTNVEQKERDEL